MNSSLINKSPSFNIFIGTFFIAFSTLALEITMTRLLSVITYYHLAFFAVSTAMLGMTAGSTTIFLKSSWFSSEKLNLNIAKSCFGYSVSVPIALFILCFIPILAGFSVMKILALLLITFACSLPFYFSGIAVSAVLTKSRLPIGKLYASDMIGAAMGCLFVLGGLDYFDAPGLILLCGSVGIISVFAFTHKKTVLGLRLLSGILFLFLLFGVIYNSSTIKGIRPQTVKGVYDDPNRFILEKWNSFSRINVYAGKEVTPENWGPSPAMPNNLKSFVYWMTIDGGAGAPLTRYSNSGDIEFLKYDVTNAGYFLRQGCDSACIIGIGGGKDILSAIHFGYKYIVGIDVNPIFIDLLQNKFRKEANLADCPGVKLVVDEARSFLSKSNEKFSFIQMSLIDTWASTGAGAYTLTENALYTLEAWKVILNHLNDKGLFTVSRWYNPNNLGETGRSVSLAVATLLDMGVKNPSNHIAMLTIGKVSTLIISKQPFVEKDIIKLRDVAAELKYDLVILPGENPSDEILRNIVSSLTRDELFLKIKDEPLNFSPPTDEDPYFFNMLRLSHLSEAYNSDIGVVSGNLYASVILVILIITLLFLTIITIIFPLLFSHEVRRKSFVNRKIFWTGALYFSLIGAGFMMIEIGLMQRLSVFLGHPVYALGILLFSIILSAGVGSYFSEFLSLDLVRSKYFLFGIAAPVIIIIKFILDLVLSSMITAPELSKIFISILVIFPLGFILGFFFPTGMKITNKLLSESTPWFWALNGIFGVLFSALAVFFSIYFGISMNFYIAAFCYLPVFLLIKNISQRFG